MSKRQADACYVRANVHHREERGAHCAELALSSVLQPMSRMQLADERTDQV